MVAKENVRTMYTFGSRTIALSECQRGSSYLGLSLPVGAKFDSYVANEAWIAPARVALILVDIFMSGKLFTRPETVGQRYHYGYP